MRESWMVKIDGYGYGIFKTDLNFYFSIDLNPFLRIRGWKFWTIVGRFLKLPIGN
jgi:hypothetical protein